MSNEGRYQDCPKCGWSNVFDTHYNVCNRCLNTPENLLIQETMSVQPVVEVPVQEEEWHTYDCYDCGLEYERNELSSTQYGLICDKCKYEDDEVEDEFTVAIKHDETKLRYDLIPADVMEAYAKVLTFGANKYSARNWEKGFDYSRVFGALMRHMWAWWSCENQDPESGMSHLNHALFNIGALIYFEANYRGTDDRP